MEIVLYTLLPFVVALGIILIPLKGARGTTNSIAGEVFGPALPVNIGVETLALNMAKSHIRQKEGVRYEGYLDSEGFLTIGIGHKVLPGEPYELGKSISEAEVQRLFARDIQTAFQAAKEQARDLGKYNAEFIAALTSVNYQLGVNWVNKFPQTYTDLKNDNAQQAITRLRNSKWNTQTPVRVSAFIQAIEQTYGVA
jgi:GH24 family phage-related lysozyme (muramidase)